VSDPLFSPDTVRRGLKALVDELAARGASLNIKVVGGAAVMIQAGRETLSQDVDALYSP
jgi:chemotaxis receptor (MCP) glutamine deamidase CheD